MGSTLEATLRAELTQLENRRAIVEDALDRLAVLNGAAPEDSPPAEPQRREERGPRRRDEKRDYVWIHPTLGRIPISREHPHFERLWKDDIERTLAALADEPGQSLSELAPKLNLTGGYLSGILRFMEAEGTIEAVNPAQRLRVHVPNKLYRVTEGASSASPGEEETEGRRKSGTNEVAALRFIEENPDTSATALAEHLGTTTRYARQVLSTLEAKGSLTSRKVGRERHYRVGESALPVPAADVPKRAAPKPAPKPKRRRGKRRKRGEGSKWVFTHVSENPGANTAEIAEGTGLQYDWAYNLCRQLEHAGRFRKELPKNRKLPARWYPAVQDPVRPQPEDKPQREVRTVPGQGVELGRLKGTSLGGAS